MHQRRLTPPLPRSHHWIVGSARALTSATEENDPSAIIIDAHRNRRGPYTAAAALIRTVHARSVADPIQSHLLTSLSVAPELQPDICVPPEIAASFAFSREGNLREWTLRLAHGIVDFLQASLVQPRAVRFCNVEHADPTDQEFIRVLLRRADPAWISVTVCTASDVIPAPLAQAVGRYAQRSVMPIPTTAVAADPSAGARAFLAAFGGGQAPDTESALLLAASELCMRMAYYDAALEWATRGQSMVDRTAAREEHGKHTRNVLFAYLLLDRYEEMEAVCMEALAQSPDPSLLAHATYAMAMLNARFHAPARRDYDAAKAWIERSLGYTETLPLSETRAVNHAFLMNTMALVEMRKGQEVAALDLIDAALAYMRREAPNKYPLECGILLHNRARLHVAGKRSAEAIDDLTRLLEVEPSSSAAYFDRGLIRQRSADYAGALKDYDLAIHWSPPYWEPHFNRAQVLTALGRAEEAIADYDRVLVLHPEHLDALINRGRLHFELDRSDQAERDATAVLRLDAENARALCLRGLLAIRRKEFAAADRDLSASITADPLLADAWANRATVHFKMGRLEAALEDIDRALALREDADILHNRGRILEACAAKGNRRAR